MNRRLIVILGCCAACTGVALGLHAGVVNLPNRSFETPTNSFVNINIDSWQKTPRPPDYDEGGGFMWTQLTGGFKNTAANSADHIDNCDGNQAIWLFAVPEVGLFQDYDSVDWNDASPTHDFNATYEAGKSYDFTIGVIGTGGGMLQGVTLELCLYYRDAQSNMVPVSVTSVTNISTVFSNNTHLVDCSVHVPVVRSTDAWAGQHIGVRLLSTVTPELEGGYWDLDNARLTSTLEPFLSNPLAANGQFQCSVQSEPGLVFEILASTNVALPVVQWDNLGTVTNLTGTISFTDALNLSRRFYRAHQVP